MVIVRISEHSHAVKLGCLDELAQLLKIGIGLAREADDKRRANPNAGHRFSHPLHQPQEYIARRAALHSLQDVGAGVLQRDIDVAANLVVLGDRIQQALADAVRVGIEKTNPARLFDARQAVEQRRQTVLDAQIFAIRRRILANQVDLSHAALEQSLRLTHHRLKPAAAKAAPELRDDAECAGVIAALVDLDVRHMARRSEPPRRQIVIEIRRRFGSGRLEFATLAMRHDLFQFVRPQHGVDFRNLIPQLVSVALDQTTGNHQPPRPPGLLVLRHLENRVDRFLLRRIDKAARIHDQRFGISRIARKLMPARFKDAHHHLAIDEVLRATQTNETNFHGRSKRNEPLL